MQISIILLNMLKVKPRIIVVMGPTASGKSDAAIKLAKEFNGEVISADSRQIYKGLNLGSGKITRDKFKPIFNFQFSIFKHKEGFYSEGIKHYLIDVAEPMEEFNVSHFKKAAEKAIEEILSKGKLPIICGGTGFWIQALTNDMQLPDVKPNPALRSMLRSKSAEELFEQLKKIDPERAKKIDGKNPVRLIRAIEIATAIGKVPAIQDTRYKIQDTNKYEFLEIAIDVPREILNAKIKKRLDERFDAGMIEEAENLNKNGVSFEWMEKIGLEYRWISRFLQKQISLQEMQEKLYFDSIHYAKRQMTWLKKNKKILWQENYDQIKKEVEKFLK